MTFKLVFGENPDLVMSLLNALLPLDEDHQITSVEYATSEMIPAHPGKKNSIVDVRCKDVEGRQFIVEMQMYWNEEFKRRVVLNASKAVVKQLDEGEDYTLIQPVYSLNLVNEVFQPDTDEFYHDYAIVNVAHSDRIIEGLRFVFVELPKFKPKSIAEKGGVRETTECLVEGNQMAVLWLRFLTEISEKTQEAPAELLENSETRKALSIVEKSAMNESQLYAYEQFWDAVVNERVLREGALKQGLAEGRAIGEAIGLAEGEAIGIAKGEAIGIAKGEAIGLAKGEAKWRAKERLQNARSLVENGVPIDLIAKSLNLTDEELQQL